MPEFLERRYNSQSRSFLSIISLVSYVLTKVAVTVYAGGVVFKDVFNIEYVILFNQQVDFFWVSAIGLVVLVGLIAAASVLLVAALLLGLGGLVRRDARPAVASWLFALAMIAGGWKLLRLVPGFRHVRPEMADRMNRDLVYEPTEAVRDFGYRARPFAPGEGLEPPAGRPVRRRPGRPGGPP